jgi:hypothetical protein
VSGQRMHVYAVPGDRYALVRAAAKDWLRDNRIPAMRSNIDRGYSVRQDRLSDLLARAERDGWQVHLHAGRPRS